MTGRTAFQKIIDEHLVKILPDGRMVLKLDWVWGHEITAPNSILDMKARELDVVFNPNRIKVMIDHVNPAKDTASAIQGKILREWSKQHGVEFLDVGNNGVCHAVIPEKGWILPGQTGIMGDSHTCTHGAFGAFTAGVGSTELENAIITGLWICPPQKVFYVKFTGKLPANVFAKDLILALIKKIGVKGATNAVIEFGGSVVEEMSMDSRMTLANMAVEAGATSGLIGVDIHTVNYLWPLIKYGYNEETRPSQALSGFQHFNSDKDAKYDRIIKIDVSDMVPMATINYSPGDVVPASEVIGDIDQVYIGSCTNGRIEDLRIAASIFRQCGNKISPKTRCIIVPATQYIYEQALKEGLLEIFINAGCFIGGPSCGACLGLSCGVLAPGETCASTTNRNFPGRMGEGGMVHLVSPATAALTALFGRMTEPTIKMCEQAIRDCQAGPKTDEMQLTGWKAREFEKPDYAKLAKLAGKGQHRNFSGKVFYLPQSNIDTDQIIQAKYLTETVKKEFAAHCLEGVPMDAKNRLNLHKSQILVAGENFGCGSSREHAPWALEGAGIKCVIASSFARIFENNMSANGLLCITLSKENMVQLFRDEPEELTIDVNARELKWDDKEISFEMSEYQKELIDSGGSTSMMVALAAELQKEEKI